MWNNRHSTWQFSAPTWSPTTTCNSSYSGSNILWPQEHPSMCIFSWEHRTWHRHTYKPPKIITVIISNGKFLNNKFNSTGTENKPVKAIYLRKMFCCINQCFRKVQLLSMLQLLLIHYFRWNLNNKETLDSASFPYNHVIAYCHISHYRVYLQINSILQIQVIYIEFHFSYYFLLFIKKETCFVWNTCTGFAFAVENWFCLLMFTSEYKKYPHQSYFTCIHRHTYMHVHMLYNFQICISIWPSKYLLLTPFWQEAPISLSKGSLLYSSIFAGDHSLSSCYVHFLLKFKSLWLISVSNSLMASCLSGKANVFMDIVFKFGSVPGLPG